MSNDMSMTRMNIGDRGVVKAMEVKGSIRRRLQDIGLFEGCELECVLKSPGGDPIAYRISGAIIALRNEDCNAITLTIN